MLVKNLNAFILTCHIIFQKKALSSTLDETIQFVNSFEEHSKDELVANCYLHGAYFVGTCPIDDVLAAEEFDALTHRDSLSIPSCIYVEVVDKDSYAVNGVYCLSNSLYERRNFVYKSISSLFSSLRYEIYYNDESWNIVEINNNQAPVILYSSFPDKEKSSEPAYARSTLKIAHQRWEAVPTFNREYNDTIKIDITRIKLSVSDLKVIIATMGFATGNFTICQISECARRYNLKKLSQTQHGLESLDDEHSLHYHRMLGKLSEVLGNNFKAIKHYAQALFCIEREVVRLSTETQFHLWLKSEVYECLAYVLIRVGQMKFSFDFVKLALVISPDKQQRQKLNTDLGDLLLAIGNESGALAFYWNAKMNAKDANGNPDINEFYDHLTNEKRTIGCFLSANFTNDEALLYKQTRNRLILKVGRPASYIAESTTWNAETSIGVRANEFELQSRHSATVMNEIHRPVEQVCAVPRINASSKFNDISDVEETNSRSCYKLAIAKPTQIPIQFVT